MNRKTVSTLIICIFLVGIMSFSSFTALGVVETYVFTLKWGTQGSGDGQFSYPSGVAVDGSGNVYVADLGNHRIQKFSSTGVFLTKWGTQGSGNGQFEAPTDIAVDSSGNVYVVDSGNNRVQKFSSSGVFLTKWGSLGSGDGQFNSTRGVAVDNSGNVYVIDAYNGRVQKFSSSGVYLTQWGSLGSGDGQFSYPSGVAVDGSGNVYVIENNRVQKFSSTGVFLTKWGSLGSGDGQFYNLYGVAVDSLGNVYVTDFGNVNRVQKFSSSGVFLTKWGSSGSGDGQFAQTSKVAVDASGNVYVADSNNYRIQKFAAVSTNFTISVTQRANGVIAPGTVTVNSGSDQTFTVTPNSGYTIASITTDAGAVTVTSPSGQTVSFNNVQATHTITATYALTPIPTPTPVPTATPLPTTAPTSPPNPTPTPTRTLTPTPTSAPTLTPTSTPTSSPVSTVLPEASTAFWSENLLSVVSAVIVGVVGAVVSAVSFRRLKASKRNLCDKLVAKGEELIKKNELSSAVECFAKASIAAFKKNSIDAVAKALERYIETAKSLVINSVLGSSKTEVIDHISKLQSAITKVTSDKRIQSLIVGSNLKGFSDLDLLLAKARENDLDFVVDETLKTPEIEHIFLGALHGLDEVLVVDLAAKLGYSVDATFKLLSKSINLKKAEGYITNDCKKFVSKEYIQKQLSTRLKSP